MCIRDRLAPAPRPPGGLRLLVGPSTPTAIGTPVAPPPRVLLVVGAPVPASVATVLPGGSLGSR
eukprot:12979391-Alexandrium_andersonii.AAC.1